MSDCSNNCAPVQVFPRTINNRAGLPHIAFRIGTYSDFRQALLSGVDQSALLLPWTHRQADDPGIALLEGVAVVGDILTFYQELYANEAFLRTATWPESVRDLVQLLGYRPAPGIAGAGSVAFEFKGSAAVTVPAGFGFNAQITGQASPVDFETSAALVAIPQLSRFSLYGPWTSSAIGVGTKTLAFATSASVSFKAKDRIALVDTASATNPAWQIAVVQSVAVVLDQTILTLTGSWQHGAPDSGSLMAYKLGRTFHAFGYNAPATEITVTGGVATTTTVNTLVVPTEMVRVFPLERMVGDLSAGATVLIDLQIALGVGHSLEFLTAATISSTSLSAQSVGPMSSSVTALELSGAQTPPNGLLGEGANRRTAQCMEVIGEGFAVTGARATSATGPDGLVAAYFFGDGNQYHLLNGRELQFVKLNEDDSVAAIEQSSASIDALQIGDVNAVALRRLTLNPALQDFASTDFLLDAPSVTVLGNIVDVTQGKTQKRAVLGNGDGRAIHQTFQIPKAPLTWLGDEASTPPRVPELKILVNNIAWNEAESLFAAGAGDSSYIIRQDDAGNSWVQFGDGINGARLPSGVGNVVAIYRTGSGANGDRTPGTNPNAASTAQNLTAVRLYDTIAGGASPETSDGARAAAPGRVQTLGRLVSLEDFEYEALALPGVEKAQATWDLSDGVPLLVLVVLPANPSEAALASVQAAMSLANFARGPRRFQVQVKAASLIYVYVKLTYELFAGYQEEFVTPAIETALVDGLFGVKQRALGGVEYASRIEGAVQNVDGVSWVEVTAFGVLGAADDPSTLIVPSITQRVDQAPCAADQVLALYAGQLQASAAGGNG